MGKSKTNGGSPAQAYHDRTVQVAGIEGIPYGTIDRAIVRAAVTSETLDGTASHVGSSGIRMATSGWHGQAWNLVEEIFGGLKNVVGLRSLHGHVTSCILLVDRDLSHIIR